MVCSSEVLSRHRHSRRPGGYQCTLGEEHDAVGPTERKVEVVHDGENDHSVVGRGLADGFHHIDLVARIESARRFVEKQNSGPAHDRLSEAYQLALTAGELVDRTQGEMADIESRQDGVGAGMDSGIGIAAMGRRHAQLFASQGFAATSMEGVASACNAGKDTIYRRFPSKLALFGAVVEHMRVRILERLDREIAAAGEVSDTIARLKRVARWFLTINLDPELLAFRRIALSEGMVSGRGLQDPPKGGLFLERLIGVVADAQAAGALRAGNTEFLAWHLLHCIVYGPTNEAMLGRSTYVSAQGSG